MAQKNPVKNYDTHKTLNDLRKNMNAAIEDFAKQEDEVTIAKRDPKTGKVVKKEVKAPRYLVKWKCYTKKQNEQTYQQ